MDIWVKEVRNKMMDMDSIYREYANPVFKYLMTLCYEEETAQELTQETFYQAVKGAGKYDGSCKVSTWLCQIAKHLWYQELDRRKRKGTSPLDENLVSPKAALEEELCIREEKMELFRKVHVLEETAKEVVLLRLTGEFSFREIGDIFGKNENWARVTFYRAKQKLVKGCEDMKIKWEVIRDLFPSYIDGLTSRESNQLIEEHLGECRECREYLDEMKEDIAGEAQPVKNKKAIQPFRKLRQKTRRKILLAAVGAVLICGLIFGGGLLYYGRTWTADSEDVKMTIETWDGVASIRFSPEKKNSRLYAETGEDNTITIVEGKLAPFAKAYNANAYWSCTFIDEDTAMGLDGQNMDFSEDQVLTIKYKDRTETISLADLAREALENPPAQSDEVKMTWEKDDSGNVILGFYPEILGVSLKVEETGENQILIRQYYNGEDEPEENGCYYTFRFLEENKIQKGDGTVQDISQGDALTVQYEDKEERISYQSLWEGKNEE